MIALMDFTKYRGVIGRTIRDRGPWLAKWKSTDKKVIEEMEKLEEEMKLKEEEEERALLEAMRNKSRLIEKDYNIQHGVSPMTESTEMKRQDTIGFKRTLYGHYGSASNVNPSILWPSTQELAAFREYESVCNPRTLSEIIEDVKRRKKEEENEIAARKKEILEKMKLNKTQINTFNSKVRDAFLGALELKKKKDRMIQTIRMKVGYDISVKDELFQEEFRKMEEEEKNILKTRKKMKKTRGAEKATGVTLSESKNPETGAS